MKRPDRAIKLVRSETTDLGLVFQKKVDLVSGCIGAESIRDFGGLYLVHGRYLLEPAVALKTKFVSMIDVTLREEFKHEITKARALLPDLEVEFLNSDFRNCHLYDILRPVDTSVLFEVLLHQENYMGVLQGVTRITNKYVCIAQPCLKEDAFSVPASATLLQFWPEELKDEYREGTFWPKEPRVDKFETMYWMWGQSTSHLVTCMEGFGWSLDYGEVVDQIIGPKWEYSLLRFHRARPS